MSEKEPNKEIDYWKELSAPFEYNEIKWRVGNRFTVKKGKSKYGHRMLAYIDARAVFDRLDKVLGPENWQNEIKVRNDKTISVLKIRIPGTEEWISKSDGAGDTKVEKENLRIEKLRAEDSNSCEYYGFKKNTKEFSECLMELDLKRKQAEMHAKNLECQNVRRDNSTSGVTGFWGGVLLGMRENLACK